MKVLLTGATGFLGGRVALSLIRRQHELAVLARPDSRSQRFNTLCKVIHGDLFEPESYRKELESFRPDALLHCGWFGVAGAERNNLRQLENISASGQLFQSAINSGARRIVGVGSQGEYGPKSGRISESDEARPTTLYGVAKLATANALFAMSAAQGVSAAWGRVFSLYGPGDRGAWIIPTLIRSFSSRIAPELTRCEQIWEFTYVDDAAAALISLIESPSAQGIFNIGSGDARPLREIVLMLRDDVAPEIEPKFGALPYRPDQVMHLEADISKIREATGWAPRITLEEGLRSAILDQICAILAED